MLKLKHIIRTILTIIPLFGASLCYAQDTTYLFEQNRARFENINEIKSRAFKYLVNFNPNDNSTTIILAMRNTIKQVAQEHGYEYIPRSKSGEEWFFAYKIFYDTPNMDLYHNGIVIRETFRFPQGQEQTDRLQLTVKTMSPIDYNIVYNSPLVPVPNTNTRVKLEENISIDASGNLQSYFEKTMGIMINSADLGNRTIADYAQYFPILTTINLPPSTELVPHIAYSQALSFGYFKLPSGAKVEVTIETWSHESLNGKPFVTEISFDAGDDDKGYRSEIEVLQETEDFFKTVFNAIEIMPGSAGYLGSKLRVLFDMKVDESSK